MRNAKQLNEQKEISRREEECDKMNSLKPMRLI